MTLHKKLLALAALLLVATGATGQVVINECFTGGTDWVEILNSGSTTVDVSGWTATMTRDSGSTSVTFPANTMLAPGEFLMITESSTNPTLPGGVTRILSSNIIWVVNGDGTCALNDAAGVGVDFVLFGGATVLPPGNPLSPFSGSINNNTDFLARNSDVDTDDASDWTVSTSGTPAAVNPGQTQTNPPVVAFSASATNITAGTTVTFTQSSSNSPTSFAWDLDGDSVIDSNAASPTFTYNTVGSFDVTLTATNSVGSSTLTMPNLITVFTPTTVTAPYTEDFTNALGSEWLLSSETGGRIQITTPTDGGGSSPDSGGNAMIMDSIGGNFATNTAQLFVDFLSSPSMLLTYNFRETGDEDDPEDGVFLSDGSTTVQVVSHNGASGAWAKFTVDIGAEITANGLNPAGGIEIIFSQRDNFDVPTDGGLFDDISLLIPDTGQPNGPLASLDINRGTNVFGLTAAHGVAGPFFADGDTLEIEFGGQPLQPFLLLTGPLNRNNVVIPATGSIDIGSDPTLSDVGILLNGLEPGFFNSFAFLDATGFSALSFGLPGIAPGTVLAFQGIVLNTSPSVVEMTAAFEFTVN